MIRIKNLSKIFDNGNQTVSVFDNFNLEIAPNEFVVIFGPSGCGKSTLINMIAGTEYYEHGRIEGLHENQRIGYVSQQSSLLPWLKVIDNVSFGLKLQGQDKSLRYKEAYKLLDEMGLSSYAHFYPRQLSGGLSQLISFARAVAYQAEFMFMDEPFSSLDFFVRNKLQDTILKMHKKRGLTTIFITHQIDEALYLGDRIVALSPSKPTKVLKELDTRSLNDKTSENFYKLHRELLLYYQREI